MFSSTENISNTSYQDHSSSVEYDTKKKNGSNKISGSSGIGCKKKYHRYLKNLNNNRKYNKTRFKTSHVDNESDIPDFRLVYGPLTKEELEMKWRLGYFFMNPYEKLLARHRIPFKLVLQIIKLIILTYQLIDFGALRSIHINFIETSELSLKHLYLKDWCLAYETMPYPPALGKMAAYTKQELYENLDFVLERYNSTQEIALGNLNFASDNDTKESVEMCVRSYAVGEIWSFNETFVLNTMLQTDCFPVHSVYNKSSNTSVFNIKQFLEETNRTLNINGLIDISMSFSLRTIHLKSLHRSSEPDCYQVDVKVILDNSGHNGQMEIMMLTHLHPLTCNGCILFETGIDPNWVSSWLFNAFVLIVCLLSSSLCIRSFSRALILKNNTVKFFARYYPEEKLTSEDLLEMVDFWYILIMLNDFLSITGCIYKILIQAKLSTSYELCGLLLGTGSLFAWFGVLRYLALFKSFNILIVTVKLAAPNVLKFLVCAFFIFMGFSICGWIVLGPYHIKFRELTTSLECLYSLINGDDIFATFASMREAGFPVWLFSRLYLYIFMSLFIYVVLSMFISIIADTYDSIKHPDSDMLMKSFLRRFSEGQMQVLCDHDDGDDRQSMCASVWQSLLRLFGYRKPHNDYERIDEAIN